MGTAIKTPKIIYSILSSPFYYLPNHYITYKGTQYYNDSHRCSNITYKFSCSRNSTDDDSLYPSWRYNRGICDIIRISLRYISLAFFFYDPMRHRVFPGSVCDDISDIRLLQISVYERHAPGSDLRLHGAGDHYYSCLLYTSRCV